MESKPENKLANQSGEISTLPINQNLFLAAVEMQNFLPFSAENEKVHIPNIKNGFDVGIFSYFNADVFLNSKLRSVRYQDKGFKPTPSFLFVLLPSCQTAHIPLIDKEISLFLCQGAVSDGNVWWYCQYLSLA